jgi:uncharacterized protein (TIGR04255 family)
MPIFKPKKTETPPLLTPPILEAIFELRWELQETRDPSYPMMYGRLYEKFKAEFPVTEDLPSMQAHPESAPYVPRHRMRKEKNGYPLIQVGPGIVTINEARGYGWKTFSSLIKKVATSLVDLYPESAGSINFIKAEMRYVNGIRVDLARENPLAFLAEKLHTKVEFDPELYTVNGLSERPNSLGLNVSYVLGKPMGQLGLALNLGQFDNKPAFIQQTIIQSAGDMVPADLEGLGQWLEEAHTVAENCFQVLCKGALMEKFGSA